MPARSDPARPEVLVIDDEPPMRDALTRALELGGFKVDLAVDGEFHPVYHSDYSTWAIEGD